MWFLWILKTQYKMKYGSKCNILIVNVYNSMWSKLPIDIFKIFLVPKLLSLLLLLGTVLSENNETWRNCLQQYKPK